MFLVILLVIHNAGNCSYGGVAYILSTLIITHEPPRGLSSYVIRTSMQKYIAAFIGLLLLCLFVLSETVIFLLQSSYLSYQYILISEKKYLFVPSDFNSRLSSTAFSLGFHSSESLIGLWI